MKKRKGIWALVLMLLLSLALVGCNSSSTSNEGEPDDSTDDNGTEETAAGGQLVFGRGGDSTSLDPAATTEGEAFKVTVNLYETLINFGEQDTEIHPGLATEWSTSEDGLTHTLKLREGVKFHDGTDFNADAVVYNFERWKGGDKEQFYYYNSQFGDKIESVTAVDEHTVEFKLTTPIAPFTKT